MPKIIIYLLVLIPSLFSGCMTMEFQDNSKCVVGNCHNGFSIKRDISGIYIGHLENGKRNGKGTYKSNFGFMYVGHWKNDLYHGEGIRYFYKNRNYFFERGGVERFGQWKKGLFNGKGKVVFKNGIISGLWKEGKPVGKFKFTSDIAYCYGEYPKNKQLIFSHKDFILLTGKISWADGSKYVGKFGVILSRDHRQGVSYGSVPLGEGIYINSAGIKFKGNFKTKEHFFLLALEGTVDTEKGKYKYTLSNNRKNAPVAFKFENFEKIEETVD